MAVPVAAPHVPRGPGGNPLEGWMGRHVRVTRKKEDSLLLGELRGRYNDDFELRRRMTPDVFKRHATAYLSAVAMSFKEQPSRQPRGSTQRGVAIGLVLVPLATE